MSLPLQWREWAISMMRYGVRFTDIGRTGHSERQKYRDGDEEDGASKRESLTSAPALGERDHRRLARRLVAVRRAFGSPSPNLCGVLTQINGRVALKQLGARRVLRDAFCA